MSALRSLIRTQQWVALLDRLSTPSGKNEAKLRMQPLNNYALHEAIMHNAPFEVIGKLAGIFPKGAYSFDKDQRQALDLALATNGTSNKVVEFLMAFNPDSGMQSVDAAMPNSKKRRERRERRRSFASPPPSLDTIVVRAMERALDTDDAEEAYYGLTGTDANGRAPHSEFGYKPLNGGVNGDLANGRGQRRSFGQKIFDGLSSIFSKDTENILLPPSLNRRKHCKLRDNTPVLMDML